MKSHEPLPVGRARTAVVGLPFGGRSGAAVFSGRNGPCECAKLSRAPQRPLRVLGCDLPFGIPRTPQDDYARRPILGPNATVTKRQSHGIGLRSVELPDEPAGGFALLSRRVLS